MKPAHFTSEFQKMARSKVKRESLQASGRKGYEALLAKRGKMFAARKAADWRRSNPSGLEQIVIEWIVNLIPEFNPADKTYHEVEIGEFFADFVIGKLVIEVNGKQWHESLELRPDQANRDKGKYQEFTRKGYTILVLPESKIKSGEAMRELEAILRTIESGELRY